jgi:hypothetical protein
VLPDVRTGGFSKALIPALNAVAARTALPPVAIAFPITCFKILCGASSSVMAVLATPLKGRGISGLAAIGFAALCGTAVRCRVRLRIVVANQIY